MDAESRQRPIRRNRGANWTVSIAALVLALISVGGYLHHRDRLSRIAAEQLRLIVCGPSCMHPGAVAEFTVNTQAVGGRPLPSQVEVSLSAPDGTRLKAVKESTDDRGRLQVAMQAELKNFPWVKLRVAAWRPESLEETEMILPVQSAPREAKSPSNPISTVPDAEPAAPDALPATVRFFPEGGNLAAGVENRVYFLCFDSDGKPVSLSGTITTSHSASSPEAIAEVETTRPGMGIFTFTPRVGESYRLKITRPAGATLAPKLPEVSSDCRVAICTGPGVFPAGSPLEFNLRANQAGLPLVVAAYSRGVQVGQQPLTTKTPGAGGNPVSIALGADVAGVIRLTVFDYGVSPPKPLAERLVYRRPARPPTVHPVDGLPRPDLEEKTDPPPAGGDRSSVDWAHADLSFPFPVPNDASAAVALDLRLGTYGWRRFADPAVPREKSAGKDAAAASPAARAGDLAPPFMFDNLNQIRAVHEKNLSDFQADRVEFLNVLITGSILSGMGLIVLVAMMGLMRILSGLFVWIPALGAAACCLTVGTILLTPEPLSSGPEAIAAFACYQWTPEKGEPADWTFTREYAGLAEGKGP